MGVWLIRRELGPFVGDLVAFDALVTGAPSDFDPDVGFLRSGRDVFPGLEGPGPGSSKVTLAMAACASVKMVTVPSVCLHLGSNSL